MGRKTFVDSNTNTETLVNEWLRRTKRRKVTTRNLEVGCRQYWIAKGIKRESATYTRAFRRLRERYEYMFTRIDDGYRVTAAPEKQIMRVRHDQDRNGNPYWGSSW